MARKLSLDKDQMAVLETRITLSQLGVFSLVQIGTGWEMSIATIHRYKSPEYREASRKYSKAQYLSYRKALDRDVCYRCHDSLDTHPRCSECEILLHEGTLFGDTIDGKICTGCVESKSRQIADMYAELTA